jgi:hypothetical protein
VILTTDVALQITVVVEVLLALVAARRTFDTKTHFLRTTSVFGRFEVTPQGARTVARELTDAAATASDSVVRLANGLELGSLCAQSLSRLLELNRPAFFRGESGYGVAGR